MPGGGLGAPLGAGGLTAPGKDGLAGDGGGGAGEGGEVGAGTGLGTAGAGDVGRAWFANGVLVTLNLGEPGGRGLTGSPSLGVSLSVGRGGSGAGADIIKSFLARRL